MIISRRQLRRIINEELIREMHHHLKHDVPRETRTERERREQEQARTVPDYKKPPGRTLSGDWSPDTQELESYYQSPQFRELLTSNIYNLLKGGVKMKAKDIDSMGFASASAEFYKQMNSSSNEALERLGRELPGEYVKHAGQSGKRPQPRRSSSPAYEDPMANWYPLEERRRRRK